MEIVKSVSGMMKKSDEIKRNGKKIAIVPTMGYLHEGHLSLIKKASEVGDFIITTLFVNPTQFGPNEDFERYPRDEKRDIELSAGAGSDVLFMPETKDMYPENYYTYVTVEELSQRLCGKSRPMHFRGVATICLKLFNITKADYGIFGWKDAQQLLILKRMTKDLNLSIELIGMPIVREADGLAKSSRNAYLTPEERKQALVLSQSLELAKKHIGQNPDTPSSDIIKMIREHIQTSPLARIDYAEMVSQEDLLPIPKALPDKTLIALAVFFGKTRLIDNVRM